MSSAAEVCSPGPTPREVYRPGEVVRLRVVAKAAGVTAPVQSPLFVIAAVIREETLHGTSVMYRLINSGLNFLADPANVIRVGKPLPETPVAVATVPTASVVEDTDLETPHPLRWITLACGIFQTADKRFRIEQVQHDNGSASYTVIDSWTGEVSTGLSLRESAEQWCRIRAEGVRLEWSKPGDYWQAEHTTHAGQRRFRIYPSPGDRYFAVDERFGSQDESHPLRQSPWFDGLAGAVHWCEVRAACGVDRGCGSGREQLFYEPAIPF